MEGWREGSRLFCFPKKLQYTPDSISTIFFTDCDFYLNKSYYFCCRYKNVLDRKNGELPPECTPNIDRSVQKKVETEKKVRDQLFDQKNYLGYVRQLRLLIVILFLCHCFCVLIQSQSTVSFKGTDSSLISHAVLQKML